MLSSLISNPYIRSRVFSTRVRFYGGQTTHEVLVVGCGVAGSATALELARFGCNVTMISAAPDPKDCNSYWAQGGIIYRSDDDSPGLLAEDVCSAGAGLSELSSVMKLATDGPSVVERILIDTINVPFDRDQDGRLELCLEASHNRQRILHWGDRTGAAITECLQREVMNNPLITYRSDTTAIDLIVSTEAEVVSSHGSHPLERRCVGALCLDNASGAVESMRASSTILATGGLGEIFRQTSNPSSARGDGLAMAHRAAAALTNLEYIQFHPTTLALPSERNFLLSEALRGEGALLRNKDGEAFATRYHPMGELASRDVVARMIVAEMHRTASPHVWLDITHRDADWLRTRFPTINAHALSHGLDFTSTPLPVVPAAHYSCGGVSVDLRGRTSLPGLYAAGEVSCTGVHGANRLASTSLLEALVWGVSVAEDIASLPSPPLPCAASTQPHDSDSHDRGCGATSSPRREEEYGRSKGGGGHSEGGGGETLYQTLWAEVQDIMWDYVGIERSREGLELACSSLAKLQTKADHLFASEGPRTDTIALRNGVTTARLVAEAALANEQSVGAHYRLDTVDIPSYDRGDGDEGQEMVLQKTQEDLV